MCKFQLLSIIFEGFRLGGGNLPPPMPLTNIKKPIPNRVKGSNCQKLLKTEVSLNLLQTFLLITEAFSIHLKVM